MELHTHSCLIHKMSTTNQAANTTNQQPNNSIFRDGAGNIKASYALDSVAGWKYLRDVPPDPPTE